MEFLRGFQVQNLEKSSPTALKVVFRTRDTFQKEEKLWSCEKRKGKE
jgi:hypothetical protein